MKNKFKLEKKIIKKVYKAEAEKTAGYLISKFLIGMSLLIVIFVFGLALNEILIDQDSLSLVNFLQEDLETANRYFFSNISDFYQELPQPLSLILFTSVLILIIFVLFLIKNFSKIKNRLISFYKFYLNKK